MDKFIITVPATTANLGEGFDCLGLCLNLYNEYLFEKNQESLLLGFKEYNDINNNLVYYSYKKVFEKLKKELINVKITLKECHIPVSRGLGSSSSCIIAGVLGANLILNNILKEEEIINLCNEIEGHPDNILPAWFGGLTIGFVNNNQVYHQKLEVSTKLFFNILIPNFSLETKIARCALPKELLFSDAIRSLSRACIIPPSFEIGDFKTLKEALDNPLHERYRLPLIKDGINIKNKLINEHLIVLVSGAGPTLLLISDKKINDSLVKDYPDWKQIEVTVCNKGVNYYGI